MVATLPEALLLLALHDDKGTVHAAAFLALDHGLRAAVLAELKLRGHLQVRSDGQVRWPPRPPPPPTAPVLAAAWRALQGAPSPGPIEDWLGRLEALRDLRERVAEGLTARGVLARGGSEKMGLEVATHAMTDDALEREVREAVGDGLDAADAVAPRVGVLIALTVACHLEAVVFGERAEEADARAAWVADRDAVVRAAVGAIARAEGEW